MKLPPLPPEGEEPLPPLPNTVVSDAAVKKVIPFKVKTRAKHSSEPKGWKPASHLLDAIKGGVNSAFLLLKTLWTCLRKKTQKLL